MKTQGYAVKSAKAPLEKFEFDRRALRPRDVALDIYYAGICHSDIELLEGRYIIPFQYPIIPGHEWSAEVMEVGSKVSIIGKVVSAKFSSKSQATFLNLDQSFPHQLFTVTIWKDARRNFSYKPEDDLNGKYIVVTGLVEMDKNGLPVINVTNEKQIKLWEEEEE
jgi:hypothetical protein